MKICAIISQYLNCKLFQEEVIEIREDLFHLSLDEGGLS